MVDGASKRRTEPSNERELLSRARELVHSEFENIMHRSASYAAETSTVRAAARGLLRRRATLDSPGLVGVAIAPSIALLAAVLSILVSIGLAGYNGVISAVVKLTNSNTGKVVGITAGQIRKSFADNFEPVEIVFGVLCAVLIIVWVWARYSDRRKAASIAWLSHYEALEIEIENARLMTRGRKALRLSR